MVKIKNVILKGVLFLFIIFSIEVEGQINNTSLEVIYTKNIYNRTFQGDDESVNEVLQRINDEIVKIAPTLTFKLIINRDKSIFFVEKLLSEDERLLKIAISFGGGSEIYYNNFSEKEYLLKKEVGGNAFIIVKKPVIWELLNESKKIGKYICYKAQTIMTVNNYAKTKKVVTAWYCPNLPYSFGPLGYCFLPGLILQLEIENKASFTMNKIIFNAKERKIEKPKKGNIVTEEEYYEISKQMHEKR